MQVQGLGTRVEGLARIPERAVKLLAGDGRPLRFHERLVDEEFAVREVEQDVVLPRLALDLVEDERSPADDFFALLDAAHVGGDHRVKLAGIKRICEEPVASI